jgi:hypothetical protein
MSLQKVDGGDCHVEFLLGGHLRRRSFKAVTYFGKLQNSENQTVTHRNGCPL